MKTATVDCHPTAIVHPEARIADGVRLGPYCVIGRHVSLGRDTVVEASAVVEGFTSIGERCHIFPFSSIGLDPQDLKFKGELSTLEIGDSNVFREFVTIHRGTIRGESRTAIGSHNLFMAYSHIAHDCIVGSHCVFSNAATLGGHVLVGDYSTIGGHSGVHQFCRIGSYAFVGGYTVVTKDVLPYSKTVGHRAQLYGVNSIGLERRGFDRQRIETIRSAFRILQSTRMNVSQAVEELESVFDSDDVRLLVEFVRSSERGVIIKKRDNGG